MTFTRLIWKALRQIKRLWEIWCLIPLIEVIMRIRYHCDGRLYSEEKRILEIAEGKLGKKSDRYVIFVLYPRFGIASFTRTMIDAINRTNLNVIFVTNCRNSGSGKDYLLENCHLLIERANIGRDFGAYKDGISILQRRNLSISRLILLNDSVFYLEKGLDKLVSDLNGDEDLIGLTEVFEHHYHIQSFMISFGQRVLENKAFCTYWQNYRPVSTRRWAVHKGEVKLSRTLVRAGFAPKILFHGAQLKTVMRHQEPDELLAAIKLMPTFFRLELEDRLRNIRMTPNGLPLEDIVSLVLAPGESSGSTGHGHSELTRRRKPVSEILPGRTNIDSVVSVIDKFSFLPTAVERNWNTERFIDTVIETVTKRNQVHLGAFLFMKYFDMPVVKRDIVFREVYTLDHVYDVLTDFNEPLRDEMIADLRQKGQSKYFWGVERIMYRYGSI